MNGADLPAICTAVALAEKWERCNPDTTRTSALGLRMRRAISWLQRAEQESNDPDAAFIFYWIAFNAVYGEDRPEDYDRTGRERDAFQRYFAKMVELDTDNAIYAAVWEKFTDSVRGFLDNQFVFAPFWKSRNRTAKNPDWQRMFDSSKRNTTWAFVDKDAVAILDALFDRLYVLRNQLLHGGATWQGSVNRSQVQDGAAIMAFLVPHFINLMIDHPHIDWGSPRYPVVGR